MYFISRILSLFKKKKIEQNIGYYKVNNNDLMSGEYCNGDSLCCKVINIDKGFTRVKISRKLYRSRNKYFEGFLTIKFNINGAIAYIYNSQEIECAFFIKDRDVIIKRVRILLLEKM